jgi:hypothetical protein
VNRDASTHGRPTLAHACAVAVALCLLVAACTDPRVATPADEHAARDRLDGDALARHVEVVPGVVRASAWLRRPFVDPLGPAPRDPGHAAASIAIVVAGDADRAAVEARVRELAVQALAAEPAPEVTVLVSAALPPPPTLTRVGPFHVQESSRRGLVATPWSQRSRPAWS